MPRFAIAILVAIFLFIYHGSCLAADSLGNQPLVVNPNVGKYSLTRHIEYIEDEGWSFDELLLKESYLQFKNQKNGLSFGYVNTSYWMRFRVSNWQPITTNWVIEINGLGRSIDHIEVYTPGNGAFTKQVAGDAVAFSKRKIQHHALLFPFALTSGETSSVYIRVTTNGTLQMPIKLWFSEVYLEAEHNDTLSEGIFYGILIIMLLYNGFIYFTVRDKSYLLYVGYLFCVLGFSLSIKGVGFEYIWPEFPQWNNKSNIIFAGFGVIFVLLFAQSFLKTAENTPKLNTLIRIEVFTSMLCLSTLMLVSQHYTAGLLSVQYLFSVVTVLCAASLALKRGFTAARYYLLAWLSTFVSILLWVLNSFNMLSYYWVGSYLFQIGISLQVLLFSFALADRITLMRKEREAALVARLAESKRVASMANMFERFVPKPFLSRIAKAGIENIELGKAEEAVVTVMFADIRGFTTMSERLQPQELLNFLNAYLERIDQVIHHHNGCIDKFVGDGVMAIFEDPSSTKNAFNGVMAAIELQKAVDLYNQHRSNSGYDPISIGVGINTGSVVIGTIGSQERMDSTVLGDNVNVAARLQDLTKQLKAKVLISHQTLEAMGTNHQIQLRDVGEVLVRGRRETTHIYEVLDADSKVSRQTKLASLEQHLVALESFRAARFAEAKQIWQNCLKLYGQDTVIEHWLERCEQNDSVGRGSKGLR